MVDHDLLAVKEMYCEYSVNPLGVDTDRPRFGWVLESDRRDQRQTAYRILVSDDHGELYDSGKVISDQSVNVPYNGKKLSSGEKCYWKVRCWDKDGTMGPWSDTAAFEMGLLKESDWTGSWIGADLSVSAPLLRKEIEIPKKIKKARVYISGLGCYELYINGKRVGDHVLDPASTDYDNRILYVTYDVTELLKEGTNAIGVMLGNGFFCQPAEPNLTDAVHNYGNSPRLLMQMNIVLSDESILRLNTDDSWRVSPGPIVFNSVVSGEVYDARLEQAGWNAAGFDDSGWPGAIVKTHPGGVLESQLMPAIKVNKTLTPIALSQPLPGIYVYDLGQCFGGWCRLRVQGPKGTRVILKYGEYLDDTGQVDKRPYPGTQETEFYTLKGNDEEIYEPRFTYHPVRYVQVEGYPGEPTLEDVQGRVVYSAIDMYGEFHCSNPLLNRIHQNVEWTLTNQTFGMPLDCLHREKCSPLDPAAVSGALYTRKYMPLFWIKWLKDAKLAQKDGMIPDAAPNYRHLYPGSPTVCYLLLVWYIYQYYGDRVVLEEHYDAMKGWMEYLSSTAQDHIIIKGEYWDHMVPGKSPGEEEFMSSETPAQIIWTGSHYRNAAILAQAAEILGRDEDAQKFGQQAKEITEAFNRKWFSRDQKHYIPAVQTANLIPLALGIVPEGFEADVKECIGRSIMTDYNGHLHTGTIGTTAMVEALTRHGLADVMYRVATATTYPGWGYMVEKGATTIWECWGRFWPNPRWRADSMMMWATIDKFFYHDLAGISEPGFYSPDTMVPGFQEFEIKPVVPDGLEYAGASIRTVKGIISSRWKRNKNAFSLEVVIPVNSRAKVSIPKMGLANVSVVEGDTCIWEKGKSLKNIEGITEGVEGNDHITFTVGSGIYCFQLQ